MINITSSVRTALAIFVALILTACASSGDSPPAKTHDGLMLVPDSQFDEVYRKPGADLSVYTELGLEPCKVAFKKNWLRDQNSSRLDLSSRVTQKDVDRIKDSLGALCDEEFRAALLEDPAYSIVDAHADGEQVLVLRPAIINLDINAPDIQSANRARSYTTSAGEMTLSLELFDATTGETLARAVDKKRGIDDSRMQWSSSVSNSAEAKRMLKRWTKILREGLDEARGQ